MFRKKDQESSDESQKKIVKETKCTCNACGKVWYFGKQELLQQRGKAMSTAGAVLMCPCCAGCFLPFMKKPQNLKQCPQCQSKNVTTEEVSYDVAK